ncbi:MAG: ATP synthase F1 subunit epsilon [Lachnospiraceae bacterium]|nr:ATP synthase F1 subunit epsilon [Lachnospiraceae bacterium]MEE1341844.1 ATP synthase F1 subunit epsilon [Lachnospiraceae bacterium]
MADKTVQLQIVSPDRIFYEGEATMVEMHTSEGDIGVYPDHIPLTTTLVPGIITITETEGEKQAAIHSGFVEILGDKITILAEVAEWPEEIDVHRAEEAKIRAERRLRGEDGKEINVFRAEMALRRSIARINLSKYSK